MYFKLEASIYHYLIFPFCFKLSLMVCGQRYICQRILPWWMSRGICINFYLINWRLSRRRVFIFQLYGYCTVFSAFKVLCERLQILKIKISMFETMVKDYAGFKNIGYLVLDKEKTLYQKIDSKTFFEKLEMHILCTRMDKFANKSFYLWFATGWYMSYLIIPRIIWRILCGAWGPFKRKSFMVMTKSFYIAS